MNKVFSLVKKHELVGVLVVVIVALTVSQFEVKISSKGGENKVLSFEHNNDLLNNSISKSQQDDLNLLDQSSNLVQQDIPHLSCVADLTYNAPVSNTYNSEVPYNLSFYRGNFFSGFQDINGDNLPDYILVDDQLNQSGQTGLNASYEACVYLNNGAGWVKAYVCHARTETDNNGDAILREYRGDCAGIPTSNEQKAE